MPRGQEPLYLVFGQGQAVLHRGAGDAVVLPVWVSCGLCSFANCLELLGGIKGKVGMARRQKLVGVLAVDWLAV